MAATYATRAAPEIGPGVRAYVLDCDHATTTIHASGAPLAESVVLALLAQRHRASCRCGEALVRRSRERTHAVN